MLNMLPGGAGIDPSQMDEKAFDRIEAMIHSMTKEEREKPSTVSYTHLTPAARRGPPTLRGGCTGGIPADRPSSSLPPVSYTHLDVYKRQDLAHAGRADIARLRKKAAFVFQNYNLFRNKTALQMCIRDSAGRPRRGGYFPHHH